MENKGKKKKKNGKLLRCDFNPLMNVMVYSTVKVQQN